MDTITVAIKITLKDTNGVISISIEVFIDQCLLQVKIRTNHNSNTLPTFTANEDFQ